MTEPLRTISHSERGCFNDCRALWAARYLHGHVPLYSHPVKRLGALFEAAFAARLRAWCQRTRPHVVVDAAAVVLLPADCRRVTVAADKDAIKLRLERGEALPGCSIEPGPFRVRWGST